MGIHTASIQHSAPPVQQSFSTSIAALTSMFELSVAGLGVLGGGLEAVSWVATKAAWAWSDGLADVGAWLCSAPVAATSLLPVPAAPSN